MKRANKRLHIIKVAEKFFSHKGRKAKISEIASAAGVLDSVLYHYFKNKEDLMYSVTGERLKEALEKLLEQLEGIKDPVSRLSKLIWFQLYYHDTHPDYANLLLFECRSSYNFMQHSAFEWIRKWSNVGKTVLKEGIQAGIFHKDLCIPVLRDAIYGLVDRQNVQSLVTHEIDQAYDDLDAILDLIVPIMITDTGAPPAQPDKHRAIIQGAERVFAKNGFANATITKVARAADVSEATIYDYFENKEDLLFSLLDLQLRNNLDAMEELFDVKTPLRKLRRFMHYHFMRYLNQPAFIKIFLLDALYNPSFYASKAYPTFKHYIETIDGILDEGKNTGIFRVEIDNRIFKNLFMGAFSHMALRWHFTEQGTQADKIAEINAIINMLIRAVTQENCASATF